MGNKRDYTKIQAWKLADDLAVAIYSLTRSLPKDELYGLTGQLRRASYSAPANIVEGATRDSKKDYLHFLYIARGSLSETNYFIHLAYRLGYLSQEDADRIAMQDNSAIACLQGLIRAVEKETGKLTRLAAKITSLLALAAIQWSMVNSR